MKRVVRAAVCLLLILLCALGCVFLWRSGFFTAASLEDMQAYIQQMAPYSHLGFFLIQFLSVVLAPIPSNISAAAGGMLFGVWPAFLLTFGAVYLGSLLVFSLARALGQPFAERFVTRSAFQKYLGVIHAKTDTFLVLAFLFPFFPDDLLCILAGLTPIPFRRFGVIVMLTRPWGLLFACALGGASISMPVWGMALLGLGGAALFLLGMKYGDRVERAILDRLGRGRRDG